MSVQEPLWIDSEKSTGLADDGVRTGRDAVLTPRHSDGIPRLLLKPEEAALVLGVGRSVLYELLGTGRIESVQVGRSRRIPWAALEEYVERLRDEQRGITWTDAQ